LKHLQFTLVMFALKLKSTLRFHFYGRKKRDEKRYEVTEKKVDWVYGIAGF